MHRRGPDGGVNDVVVPVAATGTMAATIDHAVSMAEGLVHLVAIDDKSTTGRGPQQLSQYASQLAGRDDVQVATAHLQVEGYLGTPDAHAEQLARYVAEIDGGSVLLDPGYGIDDTAPVLQDLRPELAVRGIPVITAPGTPRQLDQGTGMRGAAVFVLVTGFYLALGDPTAIYDIVTAGVIGAIGAVILRNVTFEWTPTGAGTLRTVGRGITILPWFIWRILEANVQIAAVVLDPRMRIQPRIDRVDVSLSGGLPVTAYANSLTLTPGTLTVDVEGNQILVHTLTTDSRDGLLAGERERKIGYVFEGPSAAATDSPDDRGDVHPVVPLGNVTTVEEQ